MKLVPRCHFQKDLRYRYQSIEGYLSVLVNLLFFVSKVIVGFMVNSLSLIADAFHSVSDMGSSLIVLLSSKISSKPPDEKHPFGHERFEYVATFAMAVILAVTGIELVREGISKVSNPGVVKFSFFLVAFVGVTIFVKVGLGVLSSWMGRKSGSRILSVDAMHHYSDAASSVLVMVAVIMSRFGFSFVDGIFAGIIGLVLIYTGFSYSRSVMDFLIGRAPEERLVKRIKATVLSTDLVKNVHDVMVHSYGRRKFISFHIEVDRRLSQDKAHEIVEILRDRLRREIDAEITVHVDPVDTDSERVKKIESKIKAFVDENDLIREYHDLRVVDRERHKVILFDVIVSNPHSKEVDGIIGRFRSKLRELYPDFEVVVNIDPMYYY
ncbi:MAG: cation transporter [Candidatus Marinimicrobia bacterium]|nr:cation transporter [Candidatus Neomarinimicrobiota bacterium]